jgi:hypothetical protein
VLVGVVFTTGLTVAFVLFIVVVFLSITFTKLGVVVVFVRFVLAAKAVPALKGNAIVHSNSIAIIDLLLILPPPCPNDSKKGSIL